VVLRCDEGLSYDEISRITGASQTGGRPGQSAKYSTPTGIRFSMIRRYRRLISFSGAVGAARATRWCGSSPLRRLAEPHHAVVP